jgi:hypothetical protein
LTIEIVDCRLQIESRLLIRAAIRHWHFQSTLDNPQFNRHSTIANSIGTRQSAIQSTIGSQKIGNRQSLNLQ